MFFYGIVPIGFQIGSKYLTSFNTSDSGITFLPGAGVRFWLNGTTYQNNSLVSLEDIGDSNTGGDALLCMTDNRMCCARAQSPYMGILGNWYYPNGTGVANSGEMWEFYRNRGQSVVRLNRRRGGENGIYCCEIHDINSVTQFIYIGVYTANTGE